jgi:hypothetical protein
LAAGAKPFNAVTRAKIEDGRDRMRARPYAANDWLNPHSPDSALIFGVRAAIHLL